MWQYEKRLQFPVNIKNPNPKLAQVIISQYGGPDGEIGASLRYLSQRYSMPYPELKGILTDIGIEEKYCAFKKISHISPSWARLHLAQFTPFGSSSPKNQGLRNSVSQCSMCFMFGTSTRRIGVRVLFLFLVFR